MLQKAMLAGIFLLFLFCLPYTTIYAQSLNVDSLEQLLKRATADSTKAQLLNRLSANYNQSDPDKALLYAQQALALATQAKCHVELGRANCFLGCIYVAKGNNALALYYLLKSLKIREEMHDTKGISISLIWIGNLYCGQLNYNKALDYYMKALKMQETLRDKPGMAYTYTNIGIIYHEQHRESFALQYFFKALNIEKETQNQSLIANLYNNVANSYFEQHNYPLALNYYAQSLKIRQALDEKNGIADNSINIGNLYSRLGDYKTAVVYYNNTLLLCKTTGYIRGLQSAYAALSEASEKTNNIGAALAYYKLSAQMKDSLFKMEDAKQIAQLQTTYETEKKEHEIKTLRVQQEISTLKLKNRGIEMAAITALFVALGAIGYGAYRRNKLRQQVLLNEEMLRQEQLRILAIVQGEKQERTRISKDMHDELGSGLSKISLLTEVVRQQSGEQNALLQNQVTVIGKIARETATNMNELIWSLNLENISVKNTVSRMREYLGDFLEDLPINYLFHGPQTISTTTKLSSNIQHNIFLTYKEALHNAIKHAVCTEITATVAIEDNTFHVNIEDNGKGFSPSENKSVGNGLRNMRSRITSIGGSFNINSTPEQGTHISFTIPLAQSLN